MFNSTGISVHSNDFYTLTHSGSRIHWRYKVKKWYKIRRKKNIKTEHTSNWTGI